MQHSAKKLMSTIEHTLKSYWQKNMMHTRRRRMPEMSVCNRAYFLKLRVNRKLAQLLLFRHLLGNSVGLPCRRVYKT